MATLTTEDIAILNKLGEIPVLNDGWFKAADYYTKMKEYNALMRLTLSLAESSVKKASELSAPVLMHYKPQIENIDEYACKKLDQLESKYPCIKQPTEQWKETCSDLVDPVLGRVKPVLSQVQGIIDNGKQTINNIKTTSSGMVEKAKASGVGTATHIFNASFETYPGRFVTRTVDGAIGIADSLVDKYLPEEKTEDCKDEDSSDTDSDASGIEQMEEMAPTPRRVLVHAGCVTEKLRKRMYQRAMKDLTYARSRTFSALNRMKNTFDLADFAKSNLTTAKDKVDHMWKEIVTESESQDKTVFNGSVEDRIIALGQLVARQVKSGVTEFDKACIQIAEFKKDPVSKSKEYKDLISTFLSVDSFKNLTAQSISKARESVRLIQQRVQSIMESYPSLSWVAVDINMENIPLNESDLGMEQVMSTNNNSEDEVEREDTEREDNNEQEVIGGESSSEDEATDDEASIGSENEHLSEEKH